jgi:AcrR family transcriptional regulator
MLPGIRRIGGMRPQGSLKQKGHGVAEEGVKPRKNGRTKHRGAGRPAASEVEDRVECLLDLATAAFLEHGYENASISEIADRAGASKGTIYSRFPSKAELFSAVVRRRTLELQTSYAAALVPNRPLKRVLEGYGDRLIRGMSNPDLLSLYRVLIAVSTEFPNLAREFWNVGPRQSIAMLQEYLAGHPDFKGKNAQHAAEMFWSLCCGEFVLRGLLLQEEAMPEKVMRFRVKEAIRIFLAIYA